MPARPTVWQSVAVTVTVLASLVAGVVMARADAEPSPAPRAPISGVPGSGARATPVPAVRAAPAAARVSDTARTRSPAQVPEATVTYTVERGGRAEIRTRTVAARQDVRAVVESLADQPQVVAAEADVVYAALDDPDRDRQWGLDTVDADEAWTDGGHACGQVIGVVDSGVNAEHEDLRGVVRPGKNLLGPGIAMTDGSGHGTEVAGIAAAAHDNGRGIAGVAPGVRIMPLDIEDDAGLMHAGDLARAIKYAIEHDVDVLNLSLGGPMRSPNVEYWLQRAESAGIPVIASAGNAAQRDDPIIWPAASPYTIAVAAVAPTGVWASFSSTGRYVDVAAPGVAILTTGGRGGYVAGNGTSLAAPFVSGIVAMLRARQPEITPAQIRTTLTTTATDLGAPGRDARFGHGAVDAAAALARLSRTATPCFSDVGDLTLADQIERLAYAGITDGCVPDHFCPAAAVTRGQMATFISRALRRPATDADFFVDDDANPHQAGINRLAVANIARGCTSERFCPNDLVTRAQMAAFIARALDLSPAGVDVFDDDRGDTHEAAINALAAAGVTGGCDAGRPERFCPADTVTRAQMAAFLVRMMDHHAQH